MEMLNRNPKLSRITADFVQGGQTIEDIKCSVFQPFRHDRAGALLELVNELQLKRAKIQINPLKRLEQQNATQKIEYRGVDGGVSSLGGSNRSKNDQSIGLQYTGLGVNVSPVDRKAAD